MITLSATIKKLDGSFINLNKTNLLSLECSIFDRRNTSSPSWGVISNNGNIKFVDTKGDIKTLANNRNLKKGMEVSILIKNTLEDATKVINNFVTSNWGYDNNNRRVSVNLTDELEELQSILITPTELTEYTFLKKDNVSFEKIYKYLHSLTPSKFKFLQFESLDADTRLVLQTRKNSYNIYQDHNLWAAWNSFGIATLTRIFKDLDGNTIVKHSEGN